MGVAVLGYSFMGKAHSNAWRNVRAFFPDVPPVRQAVLVGRDAAQVAAAGAAYGWQETATDWRRVIERPDVDLVDVCLPGHLHAEVAQAALAAGKHVLLEKPLANDVAEAEALVHAARAARAHGVRSMVGFNYRRVPALELARDLVAQGRIGTVRQVRICYLQDWLTDESAPMTWRLRREQAGSGVIGDLASHAVDQLGFLTGDTVASVSATTRTFVPERPGPSGPEPVTVEDAAWATLETHGGAVASLEVSRVAAGRKNGFQIEVYGSRGSMAFDLEHLNQLRDPRHRRVRAGVEPDRRHHRRDGHRARAPPPRGVVAHRVTCSAGTTPSPTRPPTCCAAWPTGTDPRPSFEDGLAVQRVLAAMEQSAADGSRRVERRLRRPRRPRPRDRLRGTRRCPVPSPCSPASGPTSPSRRSRGSRPAGATTASRSRSPASTSTPGAGTTRSTSPSGSPCSSVTACSCSRSPTTSRARPSATTRSTSATATSSGHGSGATATPRASGSGRPRRCSTPRGWRRSSA